MLPCTNRQNKMLADLMQLFAIGARMPIFTTPWLRFIYVAYTKKMPAPALVSKAFWEIASCHRSDLPKEAGDR